jgi:hypothetical protein
MTFDEVVRLRNMRNKALRMRALASTLGACEGDRSSVFSRGAAIGWRISRVITGTLRGHPFAPYQRGPSVGRRMFDQVGVRLEAAVARRNRRSWELFAEELRGVYRELNDARAVTRSAELSDSFGRFLLQMRRLQQEMDIDLRHAGAAQQQSAVRLDGTMRVGGPIGIAGAMRRKDRVDLDDSAASGSWPYLAF